MLIDKIILDLARSKPITNREIKKALKGKYSRVTVANYLKKLVKQGKLQQIGAGRSVRYVPDQTIEYTNKGLEEHKVLIELESKYNFLKQLPENLQSIFTYGFSEMFNNAIEHSQSKKIQVTVQKEDTMLTFKVIDSGVGVFRNIMKKRKLKNEEEAIQDLLKGKVTTAPKAHSGEGIFFTSKTADKFVLNSYDYKLTVDNNLPDVFIEKNEKGIHGTEVTFSIDLNTKKHLNDVFMAYQSSPGEYGFDKTEVLIKLYTMGTIYISRSQARRVLSGLEKFKTIILDFNDVPTVGQAFADEVFRVFKTKYPKIKIQPINMQAGVNFMIKRAINSAHPGPTKLHIQGSKVAQNTNHELLDQERKYKTPHDQRFFT
ncbi:MAG: DUF4325 domain-containing protein [Candidatus Gracilibacteria bacterium]